MYEEKKFEILRTCIQQTLAPMAHCGLAIHKNLFDDNALPLGTGSSGIDFINSL
jgi:hypothetical protein